ncbi:hypothetical protein Pmani_026585 [Petrolisthes manimaculis]|uniref:Transcription factor CBF/NF-Y/archaeal histone domain-containing protein n=1 Tax=Petrolisthes manimaculis TaxID=1843537 RepID=A0AAE1TZY8_9EUCA|nr:hypothetical protein Pmani_026585 [Petrolisthes manimaculis]
MASPSKNGNAKDSPSRSSSHPTDLVLPTQRVKMIMKSCPDVDTVPQETLHLITKCTELFIKYLVEETIKNAEDRTHVDYEALAQIVHTKDHLEFLRDTIPKKITWAEARKLMAENDNKFEGFH